MEVRVVLLGASNVGKTALVRRLLTGTFAARDYKKVPLSFAEVVNTTALPNRTVHLTIADTGSKVDSYFAPLTAWAHAVIILYSIGDQSSFEAAQKLLVDVRRATGDSHPLLIAGTKRDYDEGMKRIVLTANGRMMAKTMMVSGFFEISAKTGESVGLLFDKAITMVHSLQTRIDDTLKRMTPLFQGFTERAGIDAPLATPGRRLLKDDTLTKISSKNPTKQTSRKAMLTSDLFIYFKPPHSSGALNVSRVIPIFRLLALSSQREESEFAFEVVDLESKRIFGFACKSDAEKQDWLDLFETSANATLPNPNRRPYYDAIQTYQVRLVPGKRVFGIPLSLSARTQGLKSGSSVLPPSIVSILDFIRLGGHMREVGIFRLPGPPGRLQQLRALLNSATEVEYGASDRHSLCWAVISFFLQQQLPIFPFVLYPQAESALKSEPATDRPTVLRNIVCYLPKEVFLVLAEVLKKMKQVVSYGEHNLTKLPAMAQTLAPILFHLRSDEAISLTSLLLENHESIFALPLPQMDKKQPAPEWLFTLNSQLLKGRLAFIKKTILGTLESIKSQRRIDWNEFEVKFQESLISVNSLLDYDPKFIKELVDMSRLDVIYFVVLEVDKLTREQKRSISQLLNIRVTMSKKTMSISKYLLQLKSELDAFTAYLDTASQWSRDERTAYLRVKKDTQRNLEVKLAVGLTDDSPLSETLKSIHLLFSDNAAKDFWDTQFGLDKLSVEALAFLDSLSALGPVTTPDDKAALLGVIDGNRRGSISIHMFAKFLTSFGGIESSVETALKLVKEPWFYGHLGASLAKKLLLTEPAGTFLVRFAPQASSVAFFVDFVEGEDVRSLKVSNATSGTGFVLEDDDADTKYPSIWAVVEKLSPLLQTPLVCELLNLQYFVGEITGTESAQLLKKETPGSYLVRFGTEPKSLAVEWLSSNQTVESATLARQPSAKRVVCGVDTFEGVEAYVAANSATLTRPVRRNEEQIIQLQLMSQSEKDYGPILRLIEKGSAKTTDIFLLTYRSFATPAELVVCLRDRFNFYKKGDNKKNRLKILQTLKLWVTEYIFDLVGDSEACALYKDFVISDIILDSQTIAAQLLQSLQKNLQGGTPRPMSGGVSRASEVISAQCSREQPQTAPVMVSGGNSEPASAAASDGGVEAYLGSPTTSTSSTRRKGESFSMLRLTLSMAGSATGASLAKNTAASLITPKSILDFPTNEVAEQLTLMEQELFDQIQPFEFLHQGWTKQDKDIRSPNLLKMIRFSNTISCWIVTEILQEDNVRKRAALLEYFVTVGKMLMGMNNFNGVMEILGGIGNSGVNRLKKTWELFNANKKASKTLEELREMMDTASNWTRYRDMVAKCAPPKLPYLGLILTDLVFIEDGNADRLESGDINFVKCERWAELLQRVKIYQLESYNAQPNRRIVDHILDAKKLNDTESYKRSLVVEPRV